MNRAAAEKKLVESIIENLKSMDYPEKCIAVEWGNRYLSVDIAVLAYDLVTPLALYELKTIKSGETIKHGIQYLRKAALTMDINVKCYLAFCKDDKPYFELYDVTGIIYSNEEIDIVSVLKNMAISEPLLYKTLQNGIDGKIKKNLKEKRQKRIDRIKPVCWILIPLFIAAIVLLDAFKIYELTTIRLIAFGGLIVIILIPFYNEISLKDLTLKRKEKTNE